MKIRFKYIMMVALAGLSLGFVSCDDGGLDDLTGKYAAPSSATVTSGIMTDKTKTENLRTFTMDFTTQEGIAIHMNLVCNTYYLQGTTYTIKDAANLKNGNFASGTSTVNGSAITDGSLQIVQDGDNYTIKKSTLFTEDNKAYTVTGSFTSSFEPDDPTAMNETPTVQDNGNGTVSVTFSTGGYEINFDWSTYQTSYSGEGNFMTIVFNLPDGKLHPGTYSPGTGYVKGYTFMNDSYTMWGIPAYEDHAGSLWYTVADGTLTTENIETGDIIVTKDGPLYTILLDQGKGGIYAQFQGAISDLDPDGGGNVTMMTSCLGTSNYAQWGWTNLIDIQLANGTLTSSYDAATYTTTYSGTGDFLQLEVYSETGVGTLARGTYEIADDSSWGAMKFKAGNVGMYGDSGTFLKTYTDGVAGSAQFITSGTLTIEGEGDATKFTLTTKDADGKDITYMFTGNVGL